VEDEMLESPLFIAFAGAAIALALRGVSDQLRNARFRRRLAALFVAHLKQVRSDLDDHVAIRAGTALIDETAYHEAVVGHFLYDLLTANVDRFVRMSSVEKTIDFFHHYKVNMSTVRARLDASQDHTASLKEATFRNLLRRLDEAIDELTGISTSVVR
jgi:hypothetical protein